MRYVERSLRYPIAVLMAYEVVAVLTGLVPPVTVVTSRHRRTMVPIIAALTVWHLLAWPCEDKCAA